MKVIVHDLQETSWQDLGIRFNERDVIIGKAAYNDKYSTSSSIAEVIGNCCQLVLISRCVYGGFSPFIQKVLECCRDRFGPFLEMRYGQTHYEVQNENKNIFGLVCCFYGDNITPDEEQSARIQSVSDGISLQARGVKIVFYDTTDKLKQINRLV